MKEPPRCALASLGELCRECQFTLRFPTTALCEYGGDMFPKAVTCKHFKHEDDEA